MGTQASWHNAETEDMARERVSGGSTLVCQPRDGAVKHKTAQPRAGPVVLEPADYGSCAGEGAQEGWAGWAGQAG